MNRRIMHGWLYQLTTMVLALIAVLFFWSTQAAWGRIEVGKDRYKVGLLGVNHIVTGTGLAPFAITSALALAHHRTASRGSRAQQVLCTGTASLGVRQHA
jgi:hypothetical protein